MKRFATASLTLELLLVVGRALASANVFDGGDEVSSVADSMLSKSTRIVGGGEVSSVVVCNSSPIQCAIGSDAISICLKRSTYMESFLQHRMQAQEGRYPYLVSLTSFGSDHFCGGSLIAKDTVLTAA